MPRIELSIKIGYSTLYILIDFRYCEEVNKTNKVDTTIKIFIKTDK